jgi:hypothetical protein
MNIFEQLEQCHIIEINGIITDNYSIDFDDDDDGKTNGWLVINFYTENGDIERWYSYNELKNAEPHGDGFIVGNEKDRIDFFVMVSVPDHISDGQDLGRIA